MASLASESGENTPRSGSEKNVEEASESTREDVSRDKAVQPNNSEDGQSINSVIHMPVGVQDRFRGLEMGYDNNLYVVDIKKNISNIENITFSDFVDRSYIYQYLILHQNSDPIKFLKNNLPFFSTKNNF